MILFRFPSRNDRTLSSLLNDYLRDRGQTQRTKNPADATT